MVSMKKSVSVSVVLNHYQGLSGSFKEKKMRKTVQDRFSIMKLRTGDVGHTSQLHKMKPRFQLKDRPEQHEDLLL